jgi:hypothetical protein
MNKALKIAAFVGVGVALSVLPTFAATLTAVTVPTSTASDALAFVGSQLADPGTYVVILLVIGIPLVFYVAKKLISLIPKK